MTAIRKHGEITYKNNKTLGFRFRTFTHVCNVATINALTMFSLTLRKSTLTYNCTIIYDYLVLPIGVLPKKF